MKDYHIAETQRSPKSGPHVEKKLNAAFVRSAEAGRYADGGGLYLQVDRSGARRWVLRIVVRGRRRDFGLGSAKLVTLAEARERAVEMRKVARNGGNPKVRERETQGRATTFEELARQVHERKFKDTKHNGKHIAQWIKTLETYAFPYIGDLSVADVHQDDIEAVIDPIWMKKPETARRVLQRISTVFDHACGKGYRTRGNPATGLRSLMRKQQDKPEHFKAIEYVEVPDLMRKLEGSSSVGAAALRFTILTALRSGTVRSATWSQIDLGEGRWIIPAENMKTREEFIVPLSFPTRGLLLELYERRTVGSDLIFPSPANPKKPLSENTMRKLLQAHYEGATVHGMRAAFRTWAREVVHAPDDVAEVSLAHAIGTKTTRAYNRSDLYHDRETLLEQWGMWGSGELEWFGNGVDINAEILRRSMEGDQASK